MQARLLGPQPVSEIGFGCMNLSHAYGKPPDEASATAVLHAALDLGINHFDTAALYGFGRNETLLGAALQPFRRRIVLASKCGLTGVDGKRVIDGRPETLKATCLQALQRLRTDVIDLYYLHRWDKRIPIEDSVGALADMVRAGWICGIGLSEVSAATLRKAYRVHPIAAIQSEYSLWTRDPEVALLDACRELGVSFVAFAPLGRGFLTGTLGEPSSLCEGDIRRGMPRFQAPHFAHNRALVEQFGALAREAGCTPSQLALAWLLNKAPHVIPIIGTTSIAHLTENVGAVRVQPSAALLARLEQLINSETVSGARYPQHTQAEIDTDELLAQVGRA